MLRRPVCWSRAQDTSEGWTKVALETPAVTELKTQFSVTQPQWMPHPGKRPPLQPPSSSYPRGPPAPMQSAWPCDAMVPAVHGGEARFSGGEDRVKVNHLLTLYTDCRLR